MVPASEDANDQGKTPSQQGHARSSGGMPAQRDPNLQSTSESSEPNSENEDPSPTSEQGDRGEQGAPGEQGPPGQQGERGEQGQQGRQGERGPPDSKASAVNRDTSGAGTSGAGSTG